MDRKIKPYRRLQIKTPGPKFQCCTKLYLASLRSGRMGSVSGSLELQETSSEMCANSHSSMAWSCLLLLPFAFFYLFAHLLLLLLLFLCLLLASVSPLAAWSFFSDALPRPQAGVGGLSVKEPFKPCWVTPCQKLPPRERKKEKERRPQPPFGPSAASRCHPWFTTTNLSYRFPIFETSVTALCGTTGIEILYYFKKYIYIYIYYRQTR